MQGAFLSTQGWLHDDLESAVAATRQVQERSEPLQPPLCGVRRQTEKSLTYCIVVPIKATYNVQPWFTMLAASAFPDKQGPLRSILACPQPQVELAVVHVDAGVPPLGELEARFRS